ncbi:DUF305 domain-containing protein [Actinophytocola sp. NPDC049390]|uniref:DUF305 domain-containing protein n=1 Tax=Actinophytocola sp. NPDC049390 TaxID=3363894 RepID=UPI0037B9F01E
MRPRRSPALILFLLAALLTACGRQDAAPARNPAPQAGTQAVASSSGLESALDATALAFAELVVSTDDQAVKLLDMGAARAESARLRRFAGELASVRRAEATRLRGILDGAGARYVDNHAGHDMPGMPTEAELRALSSAPDFDAQLTKLIRAHLTESATVAKSGASSVAHEATKAVAEEMVRERESALRTLDALG